MNAVVNRKNRLSINIITVHVGDAKKMAIKYIIVIRLNRSKVKHYNLILNVKDVLEIGI